MEQKQVNLIGLRVLNNGIIQAAELTPDILKKRLVLVTGDIGNGKSSLLNAAKIATSGTDAIKKSDVLPEGFLAEALLLDGDVPIYIGAKTDTYKRGEKEGKVKLETYLYTKDANGKAVQPIIDGVAWTASQYWKALTTELTYSLNDLFSENQTTHRKLIEKLFAPELEKMKVDEVMARITKAKEARDAARTLCQSNGAFMERFEAEGYTEESLDQLDRVDIAEIESKLSNAMIEKDRIERAPETDYKLKCAEADAKRAEQIQKLKDEYSGLQMEFNDTERKYQDEYFDELAKYDRERKTRDNITEIYNKLRNDLGNFIDYPFKDEQRNEQGQIFAYGGDNAQQHMMKGVDYYYSKRMEQYKDMKEPVRKYASDIHKKIDAVREKIDRLQEKPVEYPEMAKADTSAIDKKIADIMDVRKAAVSVNRLYDRYHIWRDWIEAKGLYEKEIDTLRKLYASIETGVPGMKIEPRETESGRVEVWMMYNGQYDPEYFCNQKKEYRFMFDYSSFQRTIIGLMLQAARLNLKPRALRLAFIDDVAFCPKDVDVLADVAEKLELKLITAWTYDADKDNLMDGQVLIEGGELFFKK